MSRLATHSSFGTHVVSTHLACVFFLQLRVEADDSPQSAQFYARHGFVSATEVSPEGRLLLAGDRNAALAAIQESLREGGGEGQGGVGAVTMNLMARLLHDVGNLQGAVDAYLKALEVREPAVVRSTAVSYDKQSYGVIVLGWLTSAFAAEPSIRRSYVIVYRWSMRTDRANACLLKMESVF